MDKTNLLTLIVTMFFALIILPNVFALTYRTDMSDGSWSQFTAGLSSASYQNELTGQSTYDRSFESLAITDFKNSCLGEWCSVYVNYNGVPTTPTIIASSSFANAGVQSLKIATVNGGGTNNSYLVLGKNELVGDSNVSFDYKLVNPTISLTLAYGYVNDLNTFTAVGTITNVGSTTLWLTKTFLVPSGKHKVAFYVNIFDTTNPAVYLDNVKIIRNNVGTFKRTSPAFCGSISNCSDINSGLYANQLGNTYWVIDYVAGATCTWSKDSISQGAMTEGTSGMYYVNVDKAVSSGGLVGANLSASCSKVPYVSKSFYVSPNLFKYGFIDGGNFENQASGEIKNTCTTDWCSLSVQVNPTSTRFIGVDAENPFDGVNSLKMSMSNSAGSNGTQLLWSRSQYAGGNTVYFSFKVLGSTTSSNMLYFGYVDDSNSFTAVTTLTDYLNSDWNSTSVVIPSGNKRFAVYQVNFASDTSNVYLDAITSSGIKKTSTLTKTNTLSGNFGLKGVTQSFYSAYLDEFGDPITGATCTLSIDGVLSSMTYNSSTGKYGVDYGFVSDGSYDLIHSCSSTNYTSQTESYTVTIGTNLSASFTFTAVSNISSYVLDPVLPNVTFVSSSNTNDLIFRVLNNSALTTFNFNWSNSDTSDKQYFAYTSTDGNTWVFSDTITFGASTSTPIQKIWNATTSKYDYNMFATIPVGTTTYYKLVYQGISHYWGTIGASSDWLNQNSPTTWTDSTGKRYDVFSDSNYSNVQSYTINPFQNLVSGDLTVGYELQFTAYGTSAGTLAIGSRVSGTDSTVNISVGTAPTRFSIPIAPNSREAQLLIKSTSASSNTYYITDYALVPRSYFLNQLEIINTDLTPLQSILRNGSSTQYVKEGQAVKVKTSAYDIVGNLSQIEVQTYLGATKVKDQFFKITSYAGNYINFNQAIDGVIDLNGIGGEMTTTSALRSITYKVIVWNTANQSVSEQYKTVSVLQFPYFPNDFKMTAEILNSKLGTNPSIRLGVKDTVVSNFLSVVFAFYDGSHSITTPNYTETVYVKDLGCTDVQDCVRELTFDKYVWDSLGDFTVQVTALINTENKNYTDSYTNVKVHAFVTNSGYSLLQMIQYNERHQNATPHTPYNSTEKIPVMLGVVDDTGKNLGDTVSPYFTLNVDGVDYTTQFYPDAFTYDEVTGTNIWLFNQYLYDDSGNLLPDMNAVKLRGKLIDKRQTQTTDNNFAFTNRCTLYPTDIVGGSADYITGGLNWLSVQTGAYDIWGWKISQNSSGWVAGAVNTLGSIAGTVALNGCVQYPPNVVGWGDGNESVLTIDNSFDLTAHADNRQALYCGQKIDDSNSIIDRVGDEFGCVLLIHEDLQQIDNVKIQLGNENSDYAVTNANKQYLEVNITNNDIIFSDPQKILRSWKQQGYFGQTPTNTITVEQFVLTAWHDFWAKDLTTDDIAEMYNFTEVIGGNGGYNFDSDFNAESYNKAVFFKVKNLSTINITDYLTTEQLQSFNTKNFLSYAKTNGLPVYQKKMRVEIYNNSSDAPLKVIETVSPFIINKAPTKKQQFRDSNGTIFTGDISERLPFHVISTMSSGNSTINNRLIANLSFLQVIKANPINSNNDNANIITNLISGIVNTFVGKDDRGNATGLFNAPLVFITNPINITIGFLLLGVILLITLMMRNVSGFFKRG